MCQTLKLGAVIFSLSPSNDTLKLGTRIYVKVEQWMLVCFIDMQCYLDSWSHHLLVIVYLKRLLPRCCDHRVCSLHLPLQIAGWGVKLLLAISIIQSLVGILRHLPTHVLFVHENWWSGLVFETSLAIFYSYIKKRKETITLLLKCFSTTMSREYSPWKSYLPIHNKVIFSH